MKKTFSRPALRLLVLVLLALTPALWSCNSETASQKAVREHADLLKVIDEDTIQHYLRRNNLQSSATRTNSGLYVVKITDGQGTPVTVGSHVRLKYVGRFLSSGANPGVSGYPGSAGNPNFPAGAIFDNSANNTATNGTAVFTGGSGAVPGFNEGLLLMRQGDRKLLLLPSALAYGPSGSSPNIPPDAALLFDVEILDVF